MIIMTKTSLIDKLNQYISALAKDDPVYYDDSSDLIKLIDKLYKVLDKKNSPYSKYAKKMKTDVINYAHHDEASLKDLVTNFRKIVTKVESKR